MRLKDLRQSGGFACSTLATEPPYSRYYFQTVLMRVRCLMDIGVTCVWHWRSV